MKTCLEMCAADLTEVYSPALFDERSMQLGVSAGVAAELVTGWNLNTKSRRDKCSSELRLAKTTEILIANPPCPLPWKLQNSNIGRSIQLESTESAVMPARTRPIFAVRESFEQMHRGDNFIFEHPSTALS